MINAAGGFVRNSADLYVDVSGRAMPAVELDDTHTHTYNAGERQSNVAERIIIPDHVVFFSCALVCV